MVVKYLDRESSIENYGVESVALEMVDLEDGECISKGGCGNCEHLSCADRYTEVSQYCNGDTGGEE